MKINVAKIDNKVRVIFSVMVPAGKPVNGQIKAIEMDHQIDLTKDQAKELMEQLGGMLEKMKEYDPNGWNEMKVLPPKNGQYIVRHKSGKWYTMWRRDGDHWVTPVDTKWFDGEATLSNYEYRSFDCLK